MAKKSKLKDEFGGYLLERVFTDVHEYETYFEFSNKESVDKLSPNVLRISFKLNGRKVEMIFPDNERVVEIVIPITKASDNPRKKSELTKRYITEYADVIPIIRLSMKNQFAAMNKVIGSGTNVKKELDKISRNKRAAAVRKVKSMAKKKKAKTSRRTSK